MRDLADERTMNRRTFLRRAGAVGALGVLAGCPGGDPERTDAPTETPTSRPDTEGGTTATETRASSPIDVPEAYAERFDRIVDVAAAGADPDGERAVNGVLSAEADDDTLLYFPAGRYRLDGSWWRESFENLGFYGPEATLVPPDGYAGNLFVIGGDGPSRDLLFDGLTFDVRAEDTGPRALHATVTDGLVVRDLSVRGVQDTDQGLTRFDVTDPDGRGRVQRMRMPDGGEPGTVATGCLVGPRSEGRVSFENCHIAGFPDNGLYASPAPGNVHVVGGRYENNGIANVRVSDGSVVQGVHVVCDEAREGVQNMRGIRLREGHGALVEDCRVELETVTASDGAITLSTGMGAATVRDTTVRVDADGVPALRAKPPSEAEETGEDGTRVRCENLSVVGDAADGSAVHVVDRDGSAFRGVCLDQTGADRDGLFFLESRGSVVADALLSVTGEPVVARDSSVRTERVRTEDEAGCSSRAE